MKKVKDLEKALANLKSNEELVVRKKVDYKKIYKKLTPTQKKRRLDWKMKQYHSSPEYRLKNIEQSKQWYKSMTPEKKKEWKARAKLYAKDYKKKSSKEFDETRDLKIYFQFKRRNIQSSARGRKLDFNLTVQDMIDIYKEQNGKCYYTDAPLDLKVYSGKKITKENLHEFRKYLTVDRTNPKKGYVKGNVRFTTFEFNTMKSDMSEKKLLETAKLIVKKLDK